MKLEIISMTPQERMYSYSQSSQIEAQTGCIGHLRGDFGAGQEFFTSWFEHRGEYKTDEFKAEFDDVVNSLREKDGLLFSRDSMTRYCRQRPEAEMVGNYCTEYGFKLKTDQHTYMLRCNPNYGDYNFYLYAYVGRFLEHYMEKAKQGIRFITPGYKEIFRIPDGDSIRIFTGGGETRDRPRVGGIQYYAIISNMHKVSSRAPVWGASRKNRHRYTSINVSSRAPVWCSV